MTQDTHQSLSERITAWIVSLAIHGLVLLLLATLVLTAVSEPTIDAVVNLEPVGRPNDPKADTSGGSAPRIKQVADTASNQTIAPLPAPSLTSNTGPSPSPDNTIARPEMQAPDPALALLTELTQAAAPYTGRGENPLVEGTSEGFQQMLGGIRGRGLDVVFVIDATRSMKDIMHQAKERIHDVIGVITGVLASDGRPPRNVRFGVVAYKDYGDDYGLAAVMAIPLTNDYQAVRDFINGLHASGGGDEPEPIHEALATAINPNMGWRRQAKNIIVLVGDAPVHPGGRDDAFEAARRFASKNQGTVSVIDVGTDRSGVLDDFQNIAKAGNGSATLLSDHQTFWRDLIITVFGRRFEHDVNTIVDRYAKTR